MPESPSQLPRRDLIILPLISLLTCLAIFALAEVGARAAWPVDETDACVITDPVLGHRYRPNCISRVKALESPWVVNRYNECGYRTDQSCGPREPGTLRVDLLGSSTSEGYMVPYERTIAATLQASLNQRCGKIVQVENMGMVGYEGKQIEAQLPEALSLQPDVVVFAVTPFDFDDPAPPTGAAGDVQPTGQDELLRRLRNFVWNTLGSRAVDVAQHFMFVNSERFATLYLSYGDRADFMRPPFTPAWQRRLAHMDNLIGYMKAKASERNVNLVLAYIPSRAQAVFLSSEHRPAGVDPFAFGRALGAIAAKHGVAYADMSDILAHVPDAGALFYPADGHLAAQGQPIVGRAIARTVVAETTAFHSCQQHPADELNAGTQTSAILR